MDNINKIQSVINALETLYVHGKQNCGIVAGSMNVLEEVKLDLIEKEKNKVDDNNGE